MGRVGVVYMTFLQAVKGGARVLDRGSPALSGMGRMMSRSLHNRVVFNKERFLDIWEVIEKCYAHRPKEDGKHFKCYSFDQEKLGLVKPTLRNLLGIRKDAVSMERLADAMNYDGELIRAVLAIGNATHLLFPSPDASPLVSKKVLENNTVTVFIEIEDHYKGLVWEESIQCVDARLRATITFEDKLRQLLNECLIESGDREYIFHLAKAHLIKDNFIGVLQSGLKHKSYMANAFMKIVGDLKVAYPILALGNITDALQTRGEPPLIKKITYLGEHVSVELRGEVSDSDVVYPMFDLVWQLASD